MENAHKITKSITLTKRGLRVFMNVVGYNKVTVHGGGNNLERQGSDNQQKWTWGWTWFEKLQGSIRWNWNGGVCE